MHEFFQRNSASLAYEAYFNCAQPSAGYQIAPRTINPKTAAEYNAEY
jgi:hypothetical protein